MKFEWEEINEDITADNIRGYTYRSKVFGGWILRVETLIDTQGLKKFDGWSDSSNSLVFIPDPNHSWIIDNE